MPVFQHVTAQYNIFILSNIFITNFLCNFLGLVWNNSSYKTIRKISSIAMKSSIHSSESDINEKVSLKSIRM